MTETDLVTGGGSAEQAELPNTVNSEFSSPATPDVPIAPPAADPTPTAEVPKDTPSGSLSTMVLPELRALANEVGVKGASGMRKSELIAAIRERRGEPDNSSSDARNGTDTGAGTTAADSGSAPAENAAETTTESSAPSEAGERQGQQRRERRGASRDTGAPGERTKRDSDQDAKDGAGQNKNKSQQDTKPDTKQDGRDQQQGDQQGNQQGRGDDDGEGRQGRRGRRFRDRRRRGDRAGGDSGNGETELRDDDVVQPVAGILDVLDNYAFVRTSGYLAGPNDVYVSMNMVRKNGLRRGDAITGAVRGAQGRRAAQPAAEVQPAGPSRHRQRRSRRGRQEPSRLHQADPAVPEPAAAPGDHARPADHPRHRPDHADRQGPARADRVAAEGGQDHDPAGHRERDHHRTTRNATSWSSSSTSGPRRSPTCSAR